MGPWGSLRVVLNSHGSLLSVHHTSTCAIIQVDVCHLHPFRQGLGIDSIVVVLCTDLNASCKAEKPWLRFAWSSQIMLKRRLRFGRDWLLHFMPCQFCSNMCVCTYWAICMIKWLCIWASAYTEPFHHVYGPGTCRPAMVQRKQQCKYSRPCCIAQMCMMTIPVVTITTMKLQCDREPLEGHLKHCA